MKILVKYNNSNYYWVDTVTTRYDCTLAILVSNEGVAFQVFLDKIEVVDGNYHCEKQIQRRVDELNNKTSMLKMQRELDEKIQEVYREDIRLMKVQNEKFRST